jgi:mevalonate kinase
MRARFYSSGKLLISGEYAVLDGVWGLAIPTKYGQQLIVEPTDRPGIHWKSKDQDGSTWFSDHFSQRGFSAGGSSPVSKNLSRLLRMCYKLNPECFSDSPGYQVLTKLDFPSEWGLGSSSTLIHNLAQWTRTDPYALLAGSFGGSGYDIAAAASEGPLLFSNQTHPASVKDVSLHWPFTDQLYFVYLNRKQSSLEGIARYRVMHNPQEVLNRIGEISQELPDIKTLDSFEALLEEHEGLIGGLINLPTVKQALFKDYHGSVKSLGAWGGDFVLATGDEDTPAYFRAKGYSTVIPFNDMIKKAP